MGRVCPATIRGFSDADRGKLDAFFREVWTPPPFAKSERWLPWILDDNPNVRGRPTLLTAELDGRFVGILFLMPTTLHHGDDAYHVAWGRDLFVDPNQRRSGIGSALYRRWIEEYDAFLGSGQSPEATHLQRDTGIPQVGEIRQCEKVYFSLGYAVGSVREGLRRAVRRLLAMSWSALPRRRLSLPGTEVREVDGFDPAVDGLWDECRRAYPGICSRDLETLTWRFVRHPYSRYGLFEARGSDGKYLGYLVTRVSDRVGWIVDFLVRPGDVDVLRALLRAADRRFRSEGAVRAVARFLAPLDEAFRAERFVFTPFGNRLVVKSKDPAIEARLTDWYVTMLDSDLDR